MSDLIPPTTNPLSEAVARLPEDVGAIFEPEMLKALKQLRMSSPAEWVRFRASVDAKIKDHKLPLKLSDLDKLTEPPKQKDKPGIIFPEYEPCPDPVDGAELLTELADTIGRFIVCDRPTQIAAALWIVHTWLVDVATFSPIANITAPEKRCGKSELLGVLGKLAYKPLKCSHMTPAVLFRTMEEYRPTMLIDEVDTFLGQSVDMIGMINNGVLPDGVVPRCVGDDHKVTFFSVYGAKALCGIGSLPADTIADRSIPLRLRRKLPHEKCERWRYADTAIWDELNQKIARFTADNAEDIKRQPQTLLESSNSRFQDSWVPLLAIAGVAGGDWPTLASNAAFALHGVEEDEPSINEQLLADIRKVFDEKQCTRIWASHLLEALNADDELPWHVWNRGQKLTRKQLGDRLKDFGINAIDVRPTGMSNRKGYKREWFEDAWTRYLPNSPVKTATTRQVTDGAASSRFQSATSLPDVAEEISLQPTDGAGCRDVAFSEGGINEEPPKKAVNGNWEGDL